MANLSTQLSNIPSTLSEKQDWSTWVRTGTSDIKISTCNLMDPRLNESLLAFQKHSLHVYSCFVISVYLRLLNMIYVQHFYLELRQQQCPHTGLSSMFCMQWFKAVKWKKTWPYRPPVSDDDEGITAVEATGGESVQLQRVQCAVVLTFCKHPEDWAANMRLFYLQDSPLLCGHCIWETKQERTYLFVLHDYSSYQNMLRYCICLHWGEWLQMKKEQETCCNIRIKTIIWE